MAITVGSLLVSLGLDSAEFKSGLSQAEKEFKRSTKRIENVGKSMQNLGRNLSIAVTAPLVALGVAATREAAKARDAMAQVQSALTSMGGASGKTAEQLKKSARELQYLSTFDDDDIMRKVTANMLTFGRVSGEQFDRAQRAAVDMATRLQQDLQPATIMIGKALNDPIKGITALGRSGIQFSNDQKKMIKSLVDTGRVAEAQNIILAELERQFKGAGKAARDAVPGSDMINKWNDFRETVGEVLLKAFERIEPMLSKILDGFLKLSPGMQTAVVVAGGLAAALGPVLFVIGGITRALAPFIAGVKLATATVQAAGVATTGWTVALATLRSTILTLTATLGPYVLVLGAIAGAVYLITRRMREGAEVSAEYRDQQEKLRKVQDRVTSATQALATATGQARTEALANARALRQETMQYLANARAALLSARAKARQKELEAQQVRFSAANAMSGGSAMAVGGNFVAQRTDLAAQKARNDAAAAQQTVKGLEEEVLRLDQIINAPPPVVSSGGGGAASGERSTRGRTAREQRDRTAEIERRFEDELIGYTQQSLSAMQQIAMSAKERAELQMRSVEWARRQTLAAIDADEDYNDAQKAELRAAVERLAMHERAAIEFQERVELEREAADLAQTEFENQRELLALSGDVADTQAERKRIALQILALEQEYRRNMLEMVLASETASDAEKRRAQAILDSLAAIDAGERASVGRANETDLERYLRELNKSPEQISEELDRIKIDGLERLNDALVDTIVNFRSLRDTVQSVVKSILADLLRLQIQQAIIKPLAQALGLGVPGFARGTNFAPGGLAIVGERGPELVNLPRGSQVIPNHELQGMRGGDTFNLSVSVTGAMNDRDARRTGQQIASAAQQRMASARRAGMAG